MTGYVDFWDRHSGFGQVVGDDGRVHRFHRRDLSECDGLVTGERVTFEASESPRGPRATHVRPARRFEAAPK